MLDLVSSRFMTLTPQLFSNSSLLSFSGFQPFQEVFSC
ncbi:hypothetical protein [Caudoviricetes sp.]|nr:hypothetical protein [Caudoviricetes sp.]